MTYISIDFASYVPHCHVTKKTKRYMLILLAFVILFGIYAMGLTLLILNAYSSNCYNGKTMLLVDKTTLFNNFTDVSTTCDKFTNSNRGECFNTFFNYECDQNYCFLAIDKLNNPTFMCLWKQSGNLDMPAKKYIYVENTNGFIRNCIGENRARKKSLKCENGIASKYTMGIVLYGIFAFMFVVVIFGCFFDIIHHKYR